MSWLTTKAIGIGLRRNDRKLWRPLTEQARDPKRAQAAVLREMLDQHAATSYGRSHGFADIGGVDDYSVAVPVVTYEDLRPYIERQERTDAQELTNETPVLYAQTSGTTGAPKLLPVTPLGMLVRSGRSGCLRPLSGGRRTSLPARFLALGRRRSRGISIRASPTDRRADSSLMECRR